MSGVQGLVVRLVRKLVPELLALFLGLLGEDERLAQLPERLGSGVGHALRDLGHALSGFVYVHNVVGANGRLSANCRL